MAIIDPVDRNRLRTDETEAFKVWYNVKYGDNTMDVTDEELGIIWQNWGDKEGHWKEVASDVTKYELSDDEIDKALERGFEDAKETSGYDGSEAGYGGAIVAGAGAVMGAITTTGAKWVGGQVGTFVAGKSTEFIAKEGAEEGTKLVSSKVTGKSVETVTEKAAEKGGTAGVEQTTKKAAKLSDIITIGIGVASAAAYWIGGEPQKEQRDSLVDIQDLEATQGAELQSTEQSRINDTRNEAQDLASLTEDTVVETNDDISEVKANIDVQAEARRNIMAKRNRGEALTETDKEQLGETSDIMTEGRKEIEDLQKDTEGLVSDTQDNLAGLQGEFDTSADAMAYTRSITGFTGGYDTQTQTLCYVTAGSQGLTGVETGIATAKMIGKGPLGWVFAAIGTAATTALGIETYRQYDFAQDVGGEIDIRETTEAINEETQALYDESIGDYAGFIDIANEQEVEMPDEVIPEDVEESMTAEADGETSFAGSSEEASDSLSLTQNQQTNDTNKKTKNKKQS